MAELDFSSIAQYLQPSEDDRKRALQSSLMVAGLGMLANNQGHYGALGPALGAGGLMGMSNYTQAMEGAQKARAGSLQQGLMLKKMQEAQEGQNLLNNFGRSGGPAAMAQGAAQGDIGPTNTNAARIGPPDFSRLYAHPGVAPERAKGMMANWELQNPKREIHGGYAVDPRALQPGQALPMQMLTPSGQGIGSTPDPAGGLPKVSPLPGSLETYGAYKDIDARAGAKYDLANIPAGNNDFRMMSRDEAIRRLREQTPAAPPVAQEAPTPATPPTAARPIRLEAGDDKIAARWAAEYERRGYPPGSFAISIRQPRKSSGDPAPITEPIAASPIRQPGGPVPTGDLLGYTPPKEKDPPKDFRWKPDGTAEPIPGGPADTSVKDAARVDAARAKAKIVTDKVDEALKQTGWSSTGIVGSMMSKIPATKAFDLERTVDTLKANLGFSELQAMREASPTGGALGQVAIQELAMLQSTIASLDKGQSESQLRKNLEAVAKHFGNWKNAVEQSSGAQPAESQQPGLTKSLMRGQVVNGHRYTGGDPNSQSSWRPVGQGTSF